MEMVSVRGYPLPPGWARLGESVREKWCREGGPPELCGDEALARVFSALAGGRAVVSELGPCGYRSLEFAVRMGVRGEKGKRVYSPSLLLIHHPGLSHRVVSAWVVIKLGFGAALRIHLCTLRGFGDVLVPGLGIVFATVPAAGFIDLGMLPRLSLALLRRSAEMLRVDTVLLPDIGTGLEWASLAEKMGIEGQRVENMLLYLNPSRTQNIECSAVITEASKLPRLEEFPVEEVPCQTLFLFATSVKYRTRLI